MAKLFVSYSRKDSIAARKLIEEFKSMDQDVWVDWEAIPPAVDWLEQIFRGIEEADAFVFMISPDSIASEVCKVEVNRAVLNNKRIIPIVLRDVNPRDTQEEIRRLNWTYIRETDNLEEGLAKVRTAIELDLDWLEEHRRLQVRALEWHRRKDPSLLLRGRDLTNARHMIQTYTSKDPTPTELQQKYIEFSYRTQRTQRIMLGLTVVTLIIMIALTLYAIDRSNAAVIASNTANQQRRIAQTNEVDARNYANLASTNEANANANANLASTQEAIAKLNEKAAKAQRSAARAQIYQGRTGELYTSTLLAIDSWQKQSSPEAEEIIRSNISLLPIPVAQDTQNESINVLQLNPDGSSFLTSSNDGMTCIREIDSGKSRFCIEGSSPVNDAIYVRNGKSIAIGYESGLVQLVDGATGKVEKEIDHEKSPVRDLDVKQGGSDLSMAYGNGKIWFQNIDRTTDAGKSPIQIGGKTLTTAEMSEDGRWYAAGSDTGVVTVWNLSNNKKFDYSHRRGSVLALAFSPGNRYIVSGGEDGYALGYEIQTGQKSFSLPHSDSVMDIHFFSDGIRLATASEDARVRVWNIVSGREETIMFQDASIRKVEISPDEKWIAGTGEDGTARVWSVYTGVEMYQIPLHSPGTALGFSNDSQFLMTGSESGNVAIWDISQMYAPMKYIPFNDLVNYSKFSASGNRLITADLHRIWSLNPQTLGSPQSPPPGSPVFDARNDDITALVVSPMEDRIGIATSGNQYIIFDFNIRIPVQPAGGVQAIAFSADGLRFITATMDGIIETWDVKSGDRLSSVDLGERILALAAGPEGVAAGTTDKIILLDAKAEQKVNEWQSPGVNQFMSFNSDGSLLASANSSGQIKIWRQAGQDYTLEHTLVRQHPYSIAFDPQSNTLAVGAVNDMYLIDASSGQEIDRVHHRGNVSDVSFSPDGKILATAALKVVQLWDASTLGKSGFTDPVQAACSRLTANFSESEWKVFFGDDPYKSLCVQLQ